MKNSVWIATIIIVAVVGLVVLIFYLALRSKRLDVSMELPFAEVVNKKVTTKRKVLILKNYTPPVDEKFPFILEDGSSYGLGTTLEILAEFEAGSEVVIEKSILLTGGTSGVTTPYLFGRIYSEKNQKEYSFHYTWGNYHFLYQDNPFWTFPLAFWQDEAIEDKFYLDVP
ncbi:MAG: hypothetical protein ACFCUL_01085 [Flavobacteriaceae bacterium]